MKRPEEIIVKFFIPALSDFGILAGVLWAVSSLSSFFPMIPAASRGLPPMFGVIFVPSQAIYVLQL